LGWKPASWSLRVQHLAGDRWIARWLARHFVPQSRIQMRGNIMHEILRHTCKHCTVYQSSIMVHYMYLSISLSSTCQQEEVLCCS
jgi:energy-converting hydrogenase Eha subunit F